VSEIRAMHVRRGVAAIAVVALLLAVAVAFLPILGTSGGVGPDMDETQSIEVARNFFTRLLYTIEPTKLYAGAFYPEMSIGLLSSWPSAVGWGLGGDLVAARVAAIVYCVGLWVVAVTLAVRTLMPALRPLAAAIACLATAAVLLVVPGAPEIVVHAQGEVSGAAWLGLGLVLVWTRPRVGALVLGLCVWHTKFIYLPFAAVGLLWAAATHETTTPDRTRLLAAELVLFLAPLVVWMMLILVRIGPDGLADWSARRIGWYGRGHSGLAEAPLVQGLRARLASPQLEWNHYPAATKARALVLLFAPCGTLLGAIALRRWRGIRSRGRDVVHGTIAVILLIFAWWYFFWNQFMWLRHLEPALLVGFAALGYGLLELFCTRVAPSYRSTAVALACGTVVALALVELPSAVQRARAAPLEGSFARVCRSETPWTVGPWPRCMRYAMPPRRSSTGVHLPLGLLERDPRALVRRVAAEDVAAFDDRVIRPIHRPIRGGEPEPRG